LAILAPGAASAKESTPAGPAAKASPPAQPGDTITWTNDLAKAFEKAVQVRKPVMICINSVRVDGGGVEPAAKGLREVVYKDLRVVTKSRKFVCVFLTSAGSSSDYGELRARFGIEGIIDSPQHIFARPDHAMGEKALLRKALWPYGKGEDAVKTLLDWMDRALAAFASREGTPDTPKPPTAEEGAPAAPAAADERAAWIAKLLGIVEDGVAARREEAVRSLVANDKSGDCLLPLGALLTKLVKDKKIPEATTVVRGLGVPLDTPSGRAVPIMADVVPALHPLLKHKDAELRANTAVTLEYIGSPESVKPLTTRVGREKDEAIANHMYRALGRCGAGNAKVRSLLLKKAKGSKSEDASFGPIVGLAYFAKDAKAARGVEKQLKAIGPPGGGRRGGGRGTLKRGMLAWTLGQIGDPKSATFMREKLLAPLENTQSWWKGPVMEYYEAVARMCEGNEEAADAVDQGIRRTLSFTGGSTKFQTDARKGRDKSRFEPKADWEIDGRDRGGSGRGGRGGSGK